MDHTVQNWPRSDLNGLVRVWPKASVLEASPCAGIIGPGFWQDGTNLLPVSHFQTWLHSSTDVPDHTVQNQPRSDLILAGCIRFLPNWSGPEASGCVRIIWPASELTIQMIRVIFCMFTGELLQVINTIIWTSHSNTIIWTPSFEQVCWHHPFPWGLSSKCSGQWISLGILKTTHTTVVQVYSSYFDNERININTIVKINIYIYPPIP